jgi:hypothetical protein
MFVILISIRGQELQEVFSRKQIPLSWESEIHNNFHISTKINIIVDIRIHHDSCECYN